MNRIQKLPGYVTMGEAMSWLNSLYDVEVSRRFNLDHKTGAFRSAAGNRN
jgi:hypothetical protein